MTNLSTLRNALQAFDYNHMTPYAVGFDRTFDRLFDYVTHQAESTGYPPYNIQKTEDYKFEIEMALAGFDKKDIEIEVAEGVLTVKSLKDKDLSLIHISEPTRHLRISYAVFCLKKKRI